jgi:hypothetical protein
MHFVVAPGRGGFLFYCVGTVKVNRIEVKKNIAIFRGSDIDAFVQTQDWDNTGADAATVSNLRIKGATATAIVTFDATSNYPRVPVMLINEAGTWMFDRVKNAPP